MTIDVCMCIFYHMRQTYYQIILIVYRATVSAGLSRLDHNLFHYFIHVFDNYSSRGCYIFLPNQSCAGLAITILGPLTVLATTSQPIAKLSEKLVFSQ